MGEKGVMLPRACLISWILLTANAATAAPIATVVELTLAIPGLGSVVVPGAGVVDVQPGQLRLPAGLLSPATFTTPVTSVTTVSALSIVGLANRPATFRAGGITSQAPGEVCATPTIPSRLWPAVAGKVALRRGVSAKTDLATTRCL